MVKVSQGFKEKFTAIGTTQQKNLPTLEEAIVMGESTGVEPKQVINKVEFA